MEFTKMHGTGNDYVYIDMFKHDYHFENIEEFIRRISDRRFGIGSDGMIMIAPSEKADVRMIMYNSDGSEGKMCGNGIRCVAKYAYENGIVDKTEISVETKSGIKELKLTVQDGKVDYVTVDMGKAILNPKDIPVITDDPKASDFISKPVIVNNQEYEITCVSMGNPHAVIFTRDIDSLDLEKIGPMFEHHPIFPERVNTEFVEVTSPHTLKMRVWERGSGETSSCGTGSCAVAVAAVLNGYCHINEEITINLKGGQLKDTYLENGHVIMKGPATHVFDGEIETKGMGL
ncbi:diaminopimelate epimerase [Parasporobacterium paucivorans]|uniref:diaminopimelate epimerase n=1 Tax=Parasporobacterium paucivorans TaxID=115544 RepID=UPI00093FA2AF